MMEPSNYLSQHLSDLVSKPEFVKMIDKTQRREIFERLYYAIKIYRMPASKMGDWLNRMDDFRTFLHKYYDDAPYLNDIDIYWKRIYPEEEDPTLVRNVIGNLAEYHKNNSFPEINDIYVTDILEGLRKNFLREAPFGRMRGERVSC